MPAVIHGVDLKTADLATQNVDSMCGKLSQLI